MLKQELKNKYWKKDYHFPIIFKIIKLRKPIPNPINIHAIKFPKNPIPIPIKSPAGIESAADDFLSLLFAISKKSN